MSQYDLEKQASRIAAIVNEISDKLSTLSGERKKVIEESSRVAIKSAYSKMFPLRGKNVKRYGRHIRGREDWNIGYYTGKALKEFVRRIKVEATGGKKFITLKLNLSTEPLKYILYPQKWVYDPHKKGGESTVFKSLKEWVDRKVVNKDGKSDVVALKILKSWTEIDTTITRKPNPVKEDVVLFSKNEQLREDFKETFRRSISGKLAAAIKKDIRTKNG